MSVVGLRRFTRLLYRGLLYRARQFDRYPLLKVFVNRPYREECWYRPYISFSEEVRTKFRRPLPPSNVQGALQEGWRAYKKLNAVHDIVSSQIMWFDKISPKSLTKSSVTATDHVRPGTILICHPRDRESRFVQTVILILKHDVQGTLGVVLNRPMTRDLSRKRKSPTIFHEAEKINNDNNTDTVFDEPEDDHQLKQQSEEEEEVEDLEHNDEEIFSVDSDRTEEHEHDYQHEDDFFNSHKPGAKIRYSGGPLVGKILLHTLRNQEHSHKVVEGLYYTLHPEAIEEITTTERARDFRLFVGYCSWLPGQLVDELDRGYWFLAQSPLNVLFQVDKYNSIDFNDTSDVSKIIEQAEPGRQHLLQAAFTYKMWTRILRNMNGEFYHFAHVFQPDFPEESEPKTQDTITN